MTQARERAPQVALRVFESPVNGVAAVPDIVRAIAAADASRADLLVIVRGGGSYEDLFGFNDERVVRAIAACATPTVAAIGHERDQPLIELVADMRASTRPKPRRRCCRNATTCSASSPNEPDRCDARYRCGSNARAARSSESNTVHRSPIPRGCCRRSVNPSTRCTARSMRRSNAASPATERE